MQPRLSRTAPPFKVCWEMKHIGLVAMDLQAQVGHRLCVSSSIHFSSETCQITEEESFEQGNSA